MKSIAGPAEAAIPLGWRFGNSKPAGQGQSRPTQREPACCPIIAATSSAVGKGGPPGGAESHPPRRWVASRTVDPAHPRPGGSSTGEPPRTTRQHSGQVAPRAMVVITFAERLAQAARRSGTPAASAPASAGATTPPGRPNREVGSSGADLQPLSAMAGRLKGSPRPALLPALPRGAPAPPPCSWPGDFGRPCGAGILLPRALLVLRSGSGRPGPHR